eukprot:TRINITY_DN2559_c0_g7_i1.p1 TRINITY_DN2559_c0_g7~~TRINITY_DN2559_c0_g7_i1.p1  ORF type:complete len:343 (+),score=59.53 TRINITY_DN2559_c0_g7_i1:80-1030(+)
MENVLTKIRRDMKPFEYDIEMAILQGALKSFRKTQVMVPFPKAFVVDGNKEYGDLQRVVYKLPSAEDLFEKKDIQLDGEVLDVLRFLYENRCLKWVPSEEPIEGAAFKPQHTFVVEHCDGNARRKEFVEKSKGFESKTGFHGSGLGNWFSISKTGLRNFSGTQKQANGALFGEGIYLSKTLRLASDFSAAGDAWDMSGLGSSIRIVGVVDWLESPETVSASHSTATEGGKVPEAYVVVPNATHVSLTKILVYTSGTAPCRAPVKKRGTAFTSTSMVFFYLFFLCLIVMAQEENRSSFRWVWRSFKNKARYVAAYIL